MSTLRPVSLRFLTLFLFKSLRNYLFFQQIYILLFSFVFDADLSIFQVLFEVPNTFNDFSCLGWDCAHRFLYDIISTVFANGIINSLSGIVNYQPLLKDFTIRFYHKLFPLKIIKSYNVKWNCKHLSKKILDSFIIRSETWKFISQIDKDKWCRICIPDLIQLNFQL